MYGKNATGMGLPAPASQNDPLAALLGGAGGPGGAMPPGLSPMDGLNAIQPPPPQGGGDDMGSLMAMLGMDGGMQGGCPMPSGGGMLDPMIFGQQRGQPPIDPFSSDPYYHAGGDQLVDQLEGMGLGANPGQAQPPGMMGGSPGQMNTPPGADFARLLGG